MKTQKTIDEWLRLAFETNSDCPPPELFLEAEWSALGEDQRRAVEAHVKSCPACSAERELARAFDESASEIGRSETGLKEILRTIESNAGDRDWTGRTSGNRRVLRFPTFARALSRPAVGLAAAAVAVLAVGIVVQTRVGGPPALPDAPTADVTRGGRVELISPTGELSEIPALFEWEPVRGAVRYEVSLLAVDDTILWQEESIDTMIALPEDIRARVQEAVSYFWRVEAFDGSGSRIAWSSLIEFRADTVVAPEEKR